VQREVYNYDAKADLEFSTVAPVVEQITLTVNDITHVADAFSGWDPNYFELVLGDCIALGPDRPSSSPDRGGSRRRRYPTTRRRPSMCGARMQRVLTWAS